MSCSSSGDAGDNVPLCERLPDFIAVVSPISDDFCRFDRKIVQKNISAFEVTDLPSCQMKAHRPALTITHGMQL